MLAALVLAALARPDDGALVTPANLKWQPGHSSLTKGAMMAVVDRDSSKPGVFILRIKLPDVYRVMPHTHPKDERVTVPTGTPGRGVTAAFRGNESGSASGRAAVG